MSAWGLEKPGATGRGHAGTAVNSSLPSFGPLTATQSVNTCGRGEGDEQHKALDCTASSLQNIRGLSGAKLSTKVTVKYTVNVFIMPTSPQASQRTCGRMETTQQNRPQYENI